MEFELLPNEIILDLFEYIPLIDLFYAFSDPNARFNQLFFVQFQKYHLDLRLLSKTKCNHICQNLIPMILDQIISLHLSNEDETPQQIELFLSYSYQLRQFTRLQSISLASIRSQQVLDQILAECFHLPCLTHLAIYHTLILMSIDDAKRFYNYIWSLPNLTDCRWKIWIGHRNDFPNPKMISTSLKRFSIPTASCKLYELTRLCEYTPNLEYLSINFYDHSHQSQLSSPILSIIRLKICFCGSINVLEYLLHSMPNLYHLTMEVQDIYINGCQWEKIIRKSLPKLKIFQFKMRFAPLNKKDKEVQLNEIIETYRTKFWIDEHQWFVRCHWYSSDEHQKFHHIHLFSLPYAFRRFPDDANYILAKSTWTYDHVTELYYTYSSISDVRFSNIQTLSLLLPFNDRFLTIITKLDRLTSLDLYVEKDENPDQIQLQIQLLLDRAPRLRSLSFGRWLRSGFHRPLMTLTSLSVCRLDLEKYVYDNEQCVQLIRSPLGRQCETLLIQVKDHRNIVNLVNNMSHLQVLKVQCRDDNWPQENHWEPIIDDEIVEWLREQLPSSCTIMRGLHFPKSVLLWIR
jgi:hypothetical protein